MAKTRRRSGGWVVGRVLGADVIIRGSSLVTVVFLALIWGQDSTGGYSNRSLATGLEFALVVFVSVFLHEYAHALAGRAFRRKVKEIVLTLMGAHTSFDGRNLTATASGVIAAAGPAMNAVIAAVSTVAAGLVAPGNLREFFGLAAYANVLLAVFNALPGIPMDGGRVLEAIVWGATRQPRVGTIAAAWGGRVVAVGVVVYVFWINFAHGASPSLFSILWSFLLFSVLWPASTEALRVARIQERVDSVNVARLMHPAIGVRYDVSVATALREAQRAEASEVVVISADGHAAGHFPTATALAVPQDRRISTYLDAVTVPLPRGAEIAAVARRPRRARCRAPVVGRDRRARRHRRRKRRRRRRARGGGGPPQVARSSAPRLGP